MKNKRKLHNPFADEDENERAEIKNPAVKIREEMSELWADAFYKFDDCVESLPYKGCPQMRVIKNAHLFVWEHNEFDETGAIVLSVERLARLMDLEYRRLLENKLLEIRNEREYLQFANKIRKRQQKLEKIRIIQKELENAIFALHLKLK